MPSASSRRPASSVHVAVWRTLAQVIQDATRARKRDMRSEPPPDLLDEGQPVELERRLGKRLDGEPNEQQRIPGSGDLSRRSTVRHASPVERLRQVDRVDRILVEWRQSPSSG